MRFCSHLDITRFMTRIIRRAGLPVWYTEGFNPHLYLTFALPLPLGFISDYEVMDIRILDDGYDISGFPSLLNSFCPNGIHFLSAKDAVKNTGEVGSADFTVVFDDNGELKAELDAFLRADSVLIKKKTKRGEEKCLDIKETIRIKELFSNENGDTVLRLNLPAGGSLNINPELIFTSLFEKTNYYCYTVTRTAVLDNNDRLFE